MNHRNRCPWLDLTKPDYISYHDQEWGVPSHDDHFLFEMLLLETAQAGLSWYTILRRREGYRAAFDNFDTEKIARYDTHKVNMLLQDPAIIRNRSKILSTIQNARSFLRIQEHYGSFDAYLWKFVDGTPVVNVRRTLQDYPSTTPEAITLSKELISRGFSFVGPTTCYAYMQATGLVNDHSIDCFRRSEIIDSYQNASSV